MYKPDESEEDDETSNSGGMMMRMRRPQAEIYRNLATGNQVSVREFGGKKYLIEDSLKQRAWKIGTETKKIAGYDCTKATFKDTAQKTDVIAWFTMDLALAAGPQTYGALPGMILEVDSNNGELLMVAKKIEFKKLKDKDLAAPTKGEKITQVEFRKKMDEWIKANGGRNGRVIIRQ